MKKPVVICRRELPAQRLLEADISPSVLEVARGLTDIEIVIREMAITQNTSSHGRHASRIDVGAVTKTSLVGYEIKSDADKLSTRWRTQRKAWHNVFNFLWLVITDKLLARVFRDEPEPLVSTSWGIIVARRHDNEIVLYKYREALSQSNISREELMYCLWKEEAVHLVQEELGWTSSTTREPRCNWYQHAAEHLDTTTLQRAVREALIARKHHKGRDGRRL